jgi:hypothetical protein
VASIDPAPLLTKEYAAVNKAATPNVVIHVPKYWTQPGTVGLLLLMYMCCKCGRTL